MENRFYHWITGRFPQNYLIKYPFRGAVIVTLFSFLFTMLYDPLNFHGNQIFSYPQLMGLYCFVAGITVYLLTYFLKLVPYFHSEEEWTLVKEILSILIILFGIGLGIYFSASLIDPQTPQWTFHNFIGSQTNAYLIGSLPFLFSLIINISQKVHHRSTESTYSTEIEANPVDIAEEMIQIKSKLKKETLEFYPSQFLYAESDGNYVMFYLNEESEISKKIIRNSIRQVEQQLTGQPHFFRTHRSFIVNLEKITGKNGNTSGYHLNLEGLSTEIPVSRQNVAKFDELFPLKA
ncbi:LytR/AlgR family response regulator transcription factor [Prolixibacter denitrificans]|jgi:hypothetical protein|uniref:LytTr DNA-binding domain-containing protein n=1 Tax=Prolixibacter denitrificans TaxID=1541063 RepID=A0A2P8C6I6_9BACT|nr:LytTR family DNA-binding domain-containing protein [Prolixibacter denitrificans]PSK80590.1 LytTr DNA-binding domain-containing protein [Prolixibacter denitrificans]GET22116.1 hypothetical protein JCM18694_23620 [Prolixibacter denitrificans]